MLIHFAEMPHGLSQLIHAGNPTHGQGTAEGPGGRSRHREKSVLQLGCVFLKGLQERRQEVPRRAMVLWCLSALALGAVALWAARMSLGMVFSSSFTMVVVSFPLQGCGKAKWDVLTLPKGGTQGSEKPEGMAGVLVQLNCACAGAPRPPPGLWRALAHGEYPRRHPKEVSQAQW